MNTLVVPRRDNEPNQPERPAAIAQEITIEGLEQPNREKSMGDVQPCTRELYRGGHAAREKGDRFTAIRIFNTILAQEPGFLQCRESLHAARLEGAKLADSLMKRSTESVRATPWLAQAKFYLHSDPVRAISAAEQALNHNPFSILAHKLLARAALAAGLPRTALFSLDFLLQHTPAEKDLAVELATALAETGDISKAVETCGRLLKDNPKGKVARRLMNRLLELANSRPESNPLSAAKAETKPWTGNGPAADTLPGQIFKWEALLRHGPNNHQVLKELGALYARESDFDRALEYYWRALQVARGKDAESELAIQQIADLKRAESRKL